MSLAYECQHGLREQRGKEVELGTLRIVESQISVSTTSQGLPPLPLFYFKKQTQDTKSIFLQKKMYGVELGHILCISNMNMVLTSYLSLTPSPAFNFFSCC